MALFNNIKAKTKTGSAKRDALYGTGLTQRKGKQAAKLFERIQNTSVNKAPETETFICTLEELKNQVDYDMLDDSQLKAVNLLSHQKYGCVIGKAGTGKTTVQIFLIREIERLYANAQNAKGSQNQYISIAFVAFMGKALTPMKRRLDVKYHADTRTIHATLGYAPEINPETGKRMFAPTYTQYNKLSYDIVVMDEGGTVPIYLFNRLIEALPKRTRIFIFGDINQLPPVHGKSILGFAMQQWPTAELSTLHRTALDNPIIANAARILRGQKLAPCKKHFVMIKINELSQIAANEVVATIQHLDKQGSFDKFNDALIVPTNEGDLGQIPLNDKLVKYFNSPRLKAGSETEYENPRIVIQTAKGTKIFGVGDKVMLTKNITDLGLTNGMTGVITSITINPQYKATITYNAGHATKAKQADFMAALNGFTPDSGNIFTTDIVDADDEKEKSERQASHIVEVKFQEETTPVTFCTSGEFSSLQTAYGFTCHKAQGSEYNTVVIVCHNTAAGFLSREWLYTAVTRAKERVILLCTDYGIKSALRRQLIKGNTLEEKAKHFIQLQKGNEEKPMIYKSDKWEY